MILGAAGTVNRMQQCKLAIVAWVSVGVMRGRCAQESAEWIYQPALPQMREMSDE